MPTARNDEPEESQMTSPSYATTILPLFRPGDIACMARHGVRLADSAWMLDPTGDATYQYHAHARRVCDAVSSERMPPDGAWPKDRISVYSARMTGGFVP
jgi:hypothetical protein